VSVPVVERIEAQGRRVTMEYVLDVCAGSSGSSRITARSPRATEINGTKPSATIARRVEAASAAQPTMVVDAQGALTGVTGLEAMLTRVAAEYPEQGIGDLKALLASPHAEEAFLPASKGRWDTWVGLWRRFAVPGDNPQEVADLPASSSPTLVTFDGPTSSRGARLRGHRVFEGEDLARLERSLLPSLGLNDSRLAGTLRRAEVEQDVDTDWPELRPRTAHSRNTGVFRVDGSVQTFVEDHEYRFDWTAARRDGSRCNPP
jgi:hypothetical protein